MSKQEKFRFIQQYIEQQKPYVCSYSAHDLVDIRPDPVGTPPKQSPSSRDRDDGFGFDTPVLRPRVGKQAGQQPERKAWSNGRDKHDATGSAGRPSTVDPRREKVSATLVDNLNKENQETITRKSAAIRASSSKQGTKASALSDEEREARLAERRERKRKRRAIVDPTREQEDDDTATTKSPNGPKGRNKKAKKMSASASLALLYGFSATNIKKNRLTLKSLPTLGVFNKGKASVKTRVSTAIKKSASHSNTFAELAFLSKTQKRANSNNKDASKSDIISLSSSSSRPPPKNSRRTNHSTVSERRGSRTTEPTVGEPSCPEEAGSKVWDIELQSECPSSAPSIHVYSNAQASTSVVMDPRTTDWFTSGRGPSTCPDKPRPSPGEKAPARALTPVGSVLAASIACVRLRDGDSSSLHPFHSASQAGLHRTDDCIDNCNSGRRLVSSKFFAQPDQVLQRDSTTHRLPQLVREVESAADESRDKSACYSTFQELDYESRIEPNSEHIENRTILPPDSVIDVPQPFDFRTPYDLPFFDDRNVSCDEVPCTGACEPLGQIPDTNGYENHVNCSQQTSTSCLSCGDELRSHLPIDWRHQHCGPLSSSENPAYLLDDLDNFHDDGDDGLDDPTVLEAEVPKGDSFAWDRNEPDASFPTGCDPPYLTDEQSKNCGDHLYMLPMDMLSFADGSASYLEECADEDDDCHPLAEPDFLEGRMLLLGLWSKSQNVRSRDTTGLLEAEVDVANRLRNHWRPQKL